MDEKIRKTVALFQQYRTTKEAFYKEQAESMLDEIMESCNKKLPLSYQGGLCGIGAMIEYLIWNDFVDGNADDIVEEIDKAVVNAINNRPWMQVDIAHGLLGLACYLYQRLYYRSQSEKPIVLILKEHLIYLIDWMDEKLRNPAVEKNYYEFYFVLILLHQLDIFNVKIEKMLACCNGQIEKKHPANP